MSLPVHDLCLQWPVQHANVHQVCSLTNLNLQSVTATDERHRGIKTYIKEITDSFFFDMQ